MTATNKDTRQYFKSDPNSVLKKLGKEKLFTALRQMLLIRNFETRAEAAYQQGKIGGFFHSYIGQEAIQTAVYEVFGPNNWWITTYRCHALALLLGATPNEVMAELYGRETGNAKGRGGSMHLYTDRMLGGFGIVGGHIPVALGASFALKYQDIKEQLAICFLGDGAMAQGAFHESLNLASLWDLPCIYVIENNQWGMGTSVERALCFKRLAEDIAPAYGMKGYSINGMDYTNCVAAFEHIKEETLKTGRPVLIEAVTERFKGHSVSDPGLYRTKEEFNKIKERDPLLLFRHYLEEMGILDEETYKTLDKEQREIVIEAMKYADSSPWPDPITLEEDVFSK
ncbi:MAG: Acetoin:2,6-dichlorophenolindophenol oxidoreductase subunit alpha [Chlamydiae bacterium]|nr:Acetoin:2,6-dichlorophenolindophenol oxidoreductase subunit alpha [Chlamydiota bacterium]